MIYSQSLSIVVFLFDVDATRAERCSHVHLCLFSEFIKETTFCPWLRLKKVSIYVFLYFGRLENNEAAENTPNIPKAGLHNIVEGIAAQSTVCTCDVSSTLFILASSFKS